METKFIKLRGGGAISVNVRTKYSESPNGHVDVAILELAAERDELRAALEEAAGLLREHMWCHAAPATHDSAVIFSELADKTDTFLQRHGDEECIDDMWREVAALRAALEEARDDSPGTPLGRWKWLHEWANRQPWFHGHLSSGFEVQLIAHLKKTEAALEEARAKYHDLIMQVEQKCPGESRHETAKRYIMQAKRRSGDQAQAQRHDGREGK